MTGAVDFFYKVYFILLKAQKETGRFVATELVIVG